MNENVKNFIDSVQNKDYTAAKDMFQGAMAEKISAAFENKKIELASQMTSANESTEDKEGNQIDEDADQLDEDADHHLEEKLAVNKPSVYKPMSASPGRMGSNEVMVKVFKNRDAMGKFLATGDNALKWKETGVEGLKSGKYKLKKVRGKDGKPANEFIKA